MFSYGESVKRFNFSSGLDGEKLDIWIGFIFEQLRLGDQWKKPMAFQFPSGNKVAMKIEWILLAVKAAREKSRVWQSNKCNWLQSVLNAGYHWILCIPILFLAVFPPFFLMFYVFRHDAAVIYFDDTCLPKPDGPSCHGHATDDLFTSLLTSWTHTWQG